MEQTFIIGSSVEIWERIKSLLLSDSLNDMASANELLNQHHFSENAKDIIVDHLNTENKNRHFFIENCKIKRVGLHVILPCLLYSF